jgi:hypothetical protein
MKKVERKQKSLETMIYRNQWVKISRFKFLTEDFIRKNASKLDWDFISQYQNLSFDLVKDYQKSVNWDEITKNQNYGIYFIEEFKDKLNWFYLSYNKSFSYSGIRRYKDYLVWNVACKKSYIDFDFFKENLALMNISAIKINQNISKEVKIQMLTFYEGHKDLI